jgi:hypothetical protein
MGRVAISSDGETFRRGIEGKNTEFGFVYDQFEMPMEQSIEIFSTRV